MNAEIKQRLDNAIKHDIQRVNPEEYEFWKVLTETHLKPTSEAFSIEGQLKSEYFIQCQTCTEKSYIKSQCEDYEFRLTFSIVSTFS